MAKVGRIKNFASEIGKLIVGSNSAENIDDRNIQDCESRNFNLHQDVKWRSLQILSKDALVRIIGILIKEIECSGQSEESFPEEEKSRNVQAIQTGKKVSGKKQNYSVNWINQQSSWNENGKSEQSRSFPKKSGSKTRKSKRICWYFNNSMCKFGRLCWNLHRRVKKLDDKLNPQKRNGQVNACNLFITEEPKKDILKTKAENSERLQESSVVVDANELPTDAQCEMEDKSQNKSKISTLECEIQESNHVDVKGTVEQSKMTTEHKSIEECAETREEDSLKPSSGKEKVAVESREVELQNDEQRNPEKSKNEISVDSRDIELIIPFESHNVISETDAADFVDKLLMKMKAEKFSEGKDKNETFPKKKGKKKLCKNRHKRRDV